MFPFHRRIIMLFLEHNILFLILRDDAYQGIYNELHYLADSPNNRYYDTTSLGTWSSVSDVDTFLSNYNRSNIYRNGTTSISCGNRITIQDGTYNTEWMIAGFDVESSRYAADGTIYDNGYGIALIPVTQLTTSQWNKSITLDGGYMGSYMHTTTLPTVATNLKKVLGSHLVQRNVLLSSSVNSSGNSNAYTWATAYCTLLSAVQMTGTFASHSNKYDDGEANYKLPIFDKTSYTISSLQIWTRGVYGYYSEYKTSHVWFSGSNNAISHNPPDHSYGVRPLIYIR